MGKNCVVLIVFICGNTHSVCIFKSKPYQINTIQTGSTNNEIHKSKKIMKKNIMSNEIKDKRKKKI